MDTTPCPVDASCTRHTLTADRRSMLARLADAEGELVLLRGFAVKVTQGRFGARHDLVAAAREALGRPA